MPIMEDMHAGFEIEIDSVLPKEATALLWDSLSSYSEGARLGQAINKVHTMYGESIVRAAMEGLTNERIALIVAQEYPRMMNLRVRSGSNEPEFHRCAIEAIRMLFTVQMKDVIQEILERKIHGVEKVEA